MKNVPEDKKDSVKLSIPLSSTVIDKTKMKKEVANNTVCHHFILRFWNKLSIGGGPFVDMFFAK